MMKIRQITDVHEAEQIYQERMTKDFPASERPPLPFFIQTMEDAATKLYVHEEDGRVAAYTVFSEADGYLLLQFFAVTADQRGRGTGSRVLREISSCYSDKKGIILESEHTAYSRDEADESVRKKRIAFYERNGYVRVPDLDLLLFGEHYHLMVHPIREDRSSDEEYMFSILRSIYRFIPKKYAEGAIRRIHCNTE